MQLMTGNLYQTTLSDLIAKGDTHLEVRCVCTHMVWMPLRLLSLPCGTSIKDLNERLSCRRCTRRPFSVEGVNAADYVPEPGRPWPPAGYQRPPTQPEMATVASPIVPDPSPPASAPISLGYDPV